MTDVVLVCGEGGVLRRLEAAGHSGFARRGEDIVCAAESIVLRTVLEVLKATEGVEVKEAAGERGRLEFWTEGEQGGAEERLRCAADFVRCAFASLSREYPGNVSFRELREGGAE